MVVLHQLQRHHIVFICDMTSYVAEIIHLKCLTLLLSSITLLYLVYIWHQIGKPSDSLSSAHLDFQMGT